MYVCVPFEKNNATGIASVAPGKARESIAVVNLPEMKFRQLMFGSKKKKFSLLKKKVLPKNKLFRLWLF